MTDPTFESIAPLLVEYYDWLQGVGGNDPENLFIRCASQEERQLLREHMADFDRVHELTEPLRELSRQGL